MTPLRSGRKLTTTRGLCVRSRVHAYGLPSTATSKVEVCSRGQPSNCATLAGAKKNSGQLAPGPSFAWVIAIGLLREGGAATI